MREYPVLACFLSIDTGINQAKLTHHEPFVHQMLSPYAKQAMHITIAGGSTQQQRKIE